MIHTALVTLAILLALVAGASAADEPYPTRPITIVNPFPPGGLADLTMRPLVPAMERILKQPVVLVNKPGASGAVGMQSAAVAKPDGYTILVSVPAISLLPEVDALFGRTPVFTRDQFVGIARINADPTILVVNADLPWKTLHELLEDARKRPGEIIFSSSGIYGASHVPMEMLLQAAGGLKMRHLPTSGGGPATTAVLGAHAHLWASTTGPAAPHIKSGKFRALAVSGATRHPNFPDVPTLKELGYDVEYYLWIALFAPKNTPANALRVLREATQKAVQEPDVKAAMDKIQVPIAYQDGDEFNAWWDADARRLAAVIKRIGKVESK
jgi:tripartite-type tricarboxylate transporter receptor subunit TctC